MGSVLGFPGGSAVKNSAANAEDSGGTGAISGPGRPPGVGDSNLLQYSCLGDPMDRGTWWATAYAAKSWTHTHTHTHTQDLCYS